MTLKDLPTATAQAVFDFVVAHLRKQNAKSTNGSQCVYRGPYNLKCAAGALISDDEYNPKWEGDSWHVLVESNKVPLDHHQLICQLQRVHDNEQISLWETGFQIIAKEFNLKYELVG